jgi:FkbM family methyltransferase
MPIRRLSANRNTGAAVSGLKRIEMGIIAKLISYTPFHKSYKEYNRKKWLKANQEAEQQLYPARITFYKQLIAEGDLVFDVGANIGNRVEVFLNCNARVVAVEPQPGCANTLREKFNNDIIIEQVGLSDKEGELEMHIATDSTVSTFDSSYIEETKDKFKYTEWKGSIKVPVTTLEKLITKHGIPKFCKIDVEGFELQVLKGLKSKIPFISIEYIVPERATAAMECIEILHAVSPGGQFNYSIGESMQWALSDWMNFDVFKEHTRSVEFNSTSFGDIYFKS